MKKYLLIGVLTIIFFSVKAQNIYTIAGKGTAGYSGDGGPADSAQLYDPSCLAIDDTGNIYIADLGNNRVRKITMATGIITTVAGNGTGGYSGDGGKATSAKINQPSGLAIDKKGNLYIGDWGNNVVRKVSTSGIITTIAGNDTAGFKGDGGKAVSAELHWPAGLAFDSKGNLYIADYYNNRVRLVDTNGNIKTYLGNSSSINYGDGGLYTSVGISHPIMVYIDNANNVYVTVSNYIRKITASTGIITAFAGELKYSGFNGDGLLADSSKMNAPAQMTMDKSGNTYICDELNYRIREVNAANTMSTCAGNGTSGFSGDSGLASSAKLNEPAGITIDASGNVYIADLLNNRVRVVRTIPTSVRQIPTANSVAVYPVPVTDKLNIKIGEQINSEISVSVIDIRGREINNLETNVTSGIITLSICSLPPGIYLARIVTNENTEIVRFVK
jgi:hypothetical protein